jgi:hypothetical protein
MEKAEVHIFEDSYIVAFLSVKQFKITPQKAASGKVVFIVEGPGLDDALTALYKNEKIGALDLIKAFKFIRSSIFALKAAR